MHAFLPCRINIVPPNACVENCRNKNSIVSYLQFSLLCPLRWDTQSYTKFLQLKSTNKNARNVIYKLKSISHSLRKALGIPLCCTFTKIRLLHITKIRTSINISFLWEVVYIFCPWDLFGSRDIKIPSISRDFIFRRDL